MRIGVSAVRTGAPNSLGGLDNKEGVVRILEKGPKVDKNQNYKAWG